MIYINAFYKVLLSKALSQEEERDGPMLNRPKNSFAKSAAAALLVMGMSASSALAETNDNSPKASFQKSSIQSEYVTDCRSNSCALTRASQWSDLPENSGYAAVAVRMGTQQLVPDVKIKEFLESGFKHFGVEKVKFFFEQNDTVGTGITFHVRGGTDGMYTLDQGDQIKNAVARNARLAKNELFANNSKTDLVASLD